MADPIEELTEKEKEALRLLLAGHDAKSAALKIDISVHTLNDRLRAARRKLGVTTSKEAARALSEAEQTGSEAPLDEAPESFVHKPLGVQETPENQDIPTAADRSESGLLHFAARRKGIVIMSLSIALAFAAFAFIPAQAPDLQAPDLQTPDLKDQTFAAETEFVRAAPSASELQARRWLGLIDFGKFDESYAEAGKDLRNQYALEKWKFALTLRMTNGKVEDRTLASAMQTGEFRGRTDGDFAVITFATLFEHDNLKNERVVLERLGAEWKVVDYEILPVNHRLN